MRGTAIAVNASSLRVLRLVKPLLLFAHLAARQVTRFAVVLDNVSDAAVVWFTFDCRERSVGTNGFNDFSPAVIVVIANFPNQKRRHDTAGPGRPGRRNYSRSRFR